MKKRTHIIVRYVLIIVVVVLIIFGSSELTSWSAVTITNVQVSDSDQDEVFVIHDLVMQTLSGKYLGLFSRANSFLYPKNQIRQIIKDTYKDVNVVDIERTDLHTLTVVIQDKMPSALICATLPDFNGNDLTLDDPSSCYFADFSGLIFKKAPSFSGNIYNRYYIPDLGVNVSASTTLIGRYATSTDEFNIIQRVYTTVKSDSIDAEAVLMKSGGEYELYVRNPDVASSTVVIYFDTISSTIEQISNLISFWNHSVDVARSKNQKLEFDYIDVRYSPNVYHRFAR